MNRIAKNKLHLSKWTAVKPVNKEKHFIVTQVVEDELGKVDVLLEAVHSGRASLLPWRALKDAEVWLIGWR